MASEAGDWTAAIKVNDLIDVKRDGAWLAAKVVSITESQFRCEFLQQIAGRTAREFIRKSSERLAPAGTHVQAVPQVASQDVQTAAHAQNFVRQELLNGFGVTLNVNDKCDCLDNNKWRAATVIGANVDQLRVHFEGWDSRWDEYISRTSRRLQPRDSQTGGAFTGDPKRAQQVPAGFFDPVVAVDNTPKFWKRVLSHGLNDPQIKKLDSLFEKACKMQDAQRRIVLGQNQNVDDLVKDLSDFKAETAEALKSLPHEAKAYMMVCNNIVSDIKSTLSDTLKQKQRQNLLSKDEEYFRKLQKSFYFVNIPSDGNCLFGATARGLQIGGKLAECKHDGEVRNCVTEARKVAVDKSTELAFDKRVAAVMHLQTDPKYAPSITAEIRHAIESASTGGGNPTSKRLLAELKAAFPGKDLHAVAESKQAIAIYGQVLMTDKVFGTELEAQALSEVLKTPLHIYYRVTEDCLKGEEIKATKVIGNQFAGDNEPISLAFYMGKSHYDLLVKKHTAPDPVELKQKEELMGKWKSLGFKKYKIVLTKAKGGEEEKIISLSQVQFYSHGEFKMPKSCSNPRGNNPVEHCLSNLLDANDNTYFLDLNFKKNGKSEIIFEFDGRTVISEYKLRFPKSNMERSPISWVIFGESKEGVQKLAQEENAELGDGGFDGSIDFFPAPEKKGEGSDSKESKTKENVEAKSGAVKENNTPAAEEKFSPGDKKVKDATDETRDTEKGNNKEVPAGALQQDNAEDDAENNDEAQPKTGELDEPN